MRDFKALHPELQEKATTLKEKCAEQGINILFSECVRTKAEQDALYAQGRTKPGSIVTNAKGSTYSSQHQWGIAVDFYIDMDVDGDGKKSDDAFNNSTKLFNKVGRIAGELGLGWGGNWTSPVDLPHLYLPDWGSTATKLKKQYGTPEKFMATWDDKDTGKAAIDKINTKDDYTRTEFIMDVQAATGSKVDGKAGTETIGNTVTVSRTKNKNHAVVTPLERRLKELGYYTGAIEADQGKTPCFGKGLEAAVNKYQKEVLGYNNTDGEVTAKGGMWKSLLGMTVMSVAKPTLKKGSKGEEVEILQQNLNYLGITDNDGNRIKVDGDFGEKTDEAVENFQDKYGLKVNGVYGSKSAAKMNTLID